MAVQGVKGSGIGQVTDAQIEQMIRDRYQRPIGEMVSERAAQVSSGAIPTAEQLFGKRVPLGQRAETKGGKLVGTLFDMGAAGQALYDYGIRPAVEIPRMAYEGAGQIGAGLGEILAQPTESSMLEIIEEGAPGLRSQIDADLSSLSERIRGQAAGKSVAKSLEDVSDSLASSAKEDAEKAKKEAADAGTTITEAVAQDELGPMGPDGAPSAEAAGDGELGPMGPDGAPGAPAATEQEETGAGDAFKGIIKQAMDNVASIRGEEPKKELEDYKEEFAKATGVDITGKVDKSQALMALGLSLMQNKAGRNFNVSNALAALGEAGEKAMPEFAKAKEVARNARIAAGKYGLSEVAKDKADKAARIAAAQKVVDDLLKSQLDSVEAAKLEGLKHKNAVDLKMLELEAEALKNPKTFDYGNVKQLEDKGLPGFKTTVGIDKETGNSVFIFPEDEIPAFGNALADVNEGINAMGEMRALTAAAMNQPGGTALERAKGFALGVQQSFGFNIDQEPIFEKRTRTIENPDGTKTKQEYEVVVGYKKDAPEFGKLQTAEAIRDRVIAQFKRFLTQETGNGISNQDIENIKNLLGKIDFTKGGPEAIRRIDEATKIFLSKREKLNTRLEGFTDKSRYRNEKSYEDSMAALRKSAAAAYGLDTSQFTTGGNLMKDETTGLDVIKIS